DARRPWPLPRGSSEAMSRRVSPRLLLCSFLFLLLAAPESWAQGGRRVLGPEPPTGQLKDICDRLCDPTVGEVPHEWLSDRSDYFVRVTERRFIIDAQNQVRPDAVLSGGPFAFVTTPEGLFGRPL